MAKRIKMWISEKSSDAMKLNKCSFSTTLNINKIECARFIAKKFGVKVLKVNRLPIVSKKRSVGTKDMTKRKASYKFIVTLEEWAKIDIENNKDIDFS